jgi:hypothetical protein
MFEYIKMMFETLIMKFSKPFNLVFAVLLLGFVSACEWGDRDISVVPLDPDELSVFYSDTVSLKVYTNEEDSIITSGSGKVFYGRYEDPYLGALSAESFMIPQLTEAFLPDEKAVYDSLVLYLKYDYFYADTSKTQTANVHLLTEEYSTLANTYYYSHSKLAHDPKTIGTKTFSARPRSTESLAIRISDELGKAIFAKGIAKEMSSDNEFKALVKGLKLAHGEKDNAAILGFLLSDAVSALKLFYHLDGPDQITKLEHSFKFGAGFTHIAADRKNTNLSGLPANNNKLGIESVTTGNKGYIQSGTGLYTRVDLPYLESLQYGFGRILVNRAYLRINVLRESLNNLVPPPMELEVYVANRQNLKVSKLNTLDGSEVKPQYVNDIFNNESYYLIDITGFITSERANVTDQGNGLIIQTPVATSANNFSRLVFGDQKNDKDRIKLDFYYTYLRD